MVKVYSRFKLGPRIQVVFPDGEGRTKQSMKDECDINQILKKYIKTGTIEHGNQHAGDYGYASGLDFTTAMNVVAKGESMFAELPAAVRNRFNNDAAYFLDFVQDSSNLDEMRDLGLAEPRAPEAGSPPLGAEEPPAGVSAPVAPSEPPMG